MRWSRVRLYAAGLVAFLLGVPLTEQVFAGAGDIAYAAASLGFSIANTSAGES